MKNYYYKKIIIIKKKFFRQIEKIFFLSKYIIKLKLIAGKRGIKNYQNTWRENLLSTLDESECIFKDLSENGLKWIVNMQNLSHNELKQITKMQNLSQNEFEQIARTDTLKTTKTCQGKN